ncbi:hypothetical protein PPACK8108_LOCUS10042 [Phakopsora pachyrhizi]|uniref:Uncharacterized protein n=1 Tax=Phakopsora pachyrhizi TaxID=170000 RepID=A0AAV0AZM8_PHAPC|nr:hypothetical protein PPACK8108_LOCUS10042 [Phakopsora pachyrhizi]
MALRFACRSGLSERCSVIRSQPRFFLCSAVILVDVFWILKLTSLIELEKRAITLFLNSGEKLFSIFKGLDQSGLRMKRVRFVWGLATGSGSCFAVIIAPMTVPGQREDLRKIIGK